MLPKEQLFHQLALEYVSFKYVMLYNMVVVCTISSQYILNKFQRLHTYVYVCILFVHQVRLPNGGSIRQSFQPESTLGDVLAFVTNQCTGQISLVQVFYVLYVYIVYVFVCVQLL